MTVDVDRDDHVLASLLAVEAGRLLVDLRHRLTASGASAEELKAAGDDLAHRYLVEALAERRPLDAVLSEEGVDAESETTRRTRLEARRVWIVDPLDGTREFSEPPRDDWAVHVALSVDGEAACGAVALPADDLVFSTADPPTLPAQGPVTRIAVSRTRPPPEAVALAGSLGGTLVEMGSAGAKTMAIIRGDADMYPHSGGQFEWDSCAPVAVALSAGLWCSRLDGTPLRYNRENPYLPDLLICRRDAAPAALEALAS